MPKYILELKPTGVYFFGGENRRSTGNEDRQAERTANYFLKSLAFPQQSTVLGAVRFFFLQYVCPDSVFNQNRIVDADGAAKYIGQRSFDIKGTDFKFGKIEAISEVFLRKDKQNYLALPFDKWSEEFGELSIVADTQTHYLPRYDAKNHYETVFTNGKDKIGFCDIFKEHTQSGNFKGNEGDDDEDGFYKQQYYRLGQGWSFAVELETAEDLSPLMAQPTKFIRLGGENRLFSLQIQESDFERDKLMSSYSHSRYPKIVLTADTYLKSPYSASDCIFSCVRTKPFRHLSSTVGTTANYANLSANPSDLKESEMFEVIERGSVYFFQDLDAAQDFAKQYLQHDYLQKAGMNQYVILPSNP